MPTSIRLQRNQTGKSSRNLWKPAVRNTADHSHQPSLAQGLLLTVSLLLLNACSAQADFFSGWRVSAGTGKVALANGSVDVSWSRNGNQPIRR